MPLQVPNLDDRTYADLVEEARSLIPTHAPEWTNHNPSDPGITLIELFAYLTEMLIFRLNRVTDANKLAFLRLLNGPDWNPAEGKSINNEIRNTVLAFRQPYRAVTVEDFTFLSTEGFNSWLAGMRLNEQSDGSIQVARAHCVPRRNLESQNLLAGDAASPGHISVVIVPRGAFDHVLFYDNGVYTDYTAEIDRKGGLPLPLKSGQNKKDGAYGQFFYVGLPEPFGDIEFRFAERGRNYSLLFEYFNGTGWFALTDPDLTDFTSNWSFDGLVSFTPPQDWAKTTVDGGAGYWVRVSTQTTPDAVASAQQVAPKMFLPSDTLRSAVHNYLEPRRLLTTVVHVVGPRYLAVGVKITLVLEPDAKEQTVRNLAIEALWRFLHPLSGGPDGVGWPFGRDVYVSEIYQLLDTLPGVDYVTKTGNLDELTVNAADAGRLTRNAKGDLVAVAVQPDELVDALIVPDDITIKMPT